MKTIIGLAYKYFMPRDHSQIHRISVDKHPSPDPSNSITRIGCLSPNFDH